MSMKNTITVSLLVLAGFLTLWLLAGCAGTTATSPGSGTPMSQADRRADEIIRAMPPQRREMMVQIFGEDPVGREARFIRAADNLNLEEEKDFELFFKLLSLGNELEFPEAYFRIGQEYQLAKMHEKAFEMFLRASAGGHADAQHQVSIMYANGVGVQRNTRQSLYWLQRASDGGNKYARIKLKHIQSLPRD